MWAETRIPAFDSWYQLHNMTDQLSAPNPTRKTAAGKCWPLTKVAMHIWGSELFGDHRGFSDTCPLFQATGWHMRLQSPLQGKASPAARTETSVPSSLSFSGGTRVCWICGRWHRCSKAHWGELFPTREAADGCLVPQAPTAHLQVLCASPSPAVTGEKARSGAAGPSGGSLAMRLCSNPCLLPTHHSFSKSGVCLHASVSPLGRIG